MFEDALREFHSRDWRVDVATLNTNLAKLPGLDAGLQFSPPSIITGDPFALTSGSCVLVVGINPGWPRSTRLREIDCARAESAWAESFDAYRHHRKTYFEEARGPRGRTRNSDPRYSRHFSRLGNTLAQTLGFGSPGWSAGPVARQLFRDHAAILDLLPYWSTNTQSLDLGAVDMAPGGCMAAWREVVGAFILEKAPQLIVVNNCGQRSLIAQMLGCTLNAVPSSDFYAGRRQDGTPVIAHPFLSSWRRTRADYMTHFNASARYLKIPRSTAG